MSSYCKTPVRCLAEPWVQMVRPQNVNLFHSAKSHMIVELISCTSSGVVSYIASGPSSNLLLELDTGRTTLAYVFELTDASSEFPVLAGLRSSAGPVTDMPAGDAGHKRANGSSAGLMRHDGVTTDSESDVALSERERIDHRLRADPPGIMASILSLAVINVLQGWWKVHAEQSATKSPCGMRNQVLELSALECDLRRTIYGAATESTGLASARLNMRRRLKTTMTAAMGPPTGTESHNITKVLDESSPRKNELVFRDKTWRQRKMRRFEIQDRMIAAKFVRSVNSQPDRADWRCGGCETMSGKMWAKVNPALKKGEKGRLHAGGN
ncbi:hypothetical protein BKA62DRAFT_675209 [Auriculariales sp. MPI-PUGE-AT-0066]|nr:hypothetical protein BKA62DRAFT_675209 [Auriculariales sp. MPI-PUGE-AT-0066]